MKILLDTCVWGGARKDLEAAGHDVDWAGDWPKDPGDEEILAYAHREGRVLVTLDKDFGEMAIVLCAKQNIQGLSALLISPPDSKGRSAFV